MYNFATLFDINYLSRGLALLKSLSTHSSTAFKLHILALDDKVVKYFTNHRDDQINIITLQDIELHFPELITAKNNRSKIEYYFTLSPYLPLYILEKFPDVDQITSMDADIYFFDDPAIIINHYQHASILITPHNFSSSSQHFNKYGKYNVSFQSFKRDVEGIACLQNWRQNCFEWCHDFYDEEHNRFADQKYLDTWKATFKNVQDINLPGAGLAPWNIENYDYEIHDNKILVNRQPLIYFHFHHLRIFNRYFAFNGLEIYAVQLKRKAVTLIYHSYLKTLKTISKTLINQEENIIRINDSLNKSLKLKLSNTEGYWFFSNYFIFHVNLHRWFNKVKKIINSPWQKY